MAGYKISVIDDKPISFWTFDGDAFDSFTRKLIVPEGDPKIIIDEIDNLNPGILHSDHELYLGYRLGMPSLVTHEQEDNHSITFGYYGNIPAHPLGYPKSYIEIPHTSSYNFQKNSGSFSVEFLLNLTSPSINGTYPIFVKEGVINISYVVGPAVSYISVTHPGGTVSLGNFGGNLNWIGNNWSGQTTHFVFTWSTTSSQNNVFGSTAKVYTNAHLVSNQNYSYLDIPPITNLNSPITIGGTSTGYWKSALNIDQIAIYDRVLSDEEVAKHVAKAFPYDEYLKKSYATNIWPFDDNDSLVDFDIAPYHGNFSGTYVGGRSRCLRNAPGPKNLYNSKACTFIDGGHALFVSKNNINNYTPRNHSAYSYEWWFNTTTTTRGVLFSIQGLEFPYNGPKVEINTRDNSFSNGSIQFSVSSVDPPLNSRYLNDSGNRYQFNQGNWHHIVITRQKDTGVLCLYLDGELHDTKIVSLGTVTEPGQITMMNCTPGYLNVHGNLSYLAFYTFDLQPHQIKGHFSYSTIYKIRGVVTLLGIPYQARLRFYSSYTGQFIQEIYSSAETGEYDVRFYNNSNIDILVSDPNDLSVRYRAYGPVKPSEFDDYPITI